MPDRFESEPYLDPIRRAGPLAPRVRWKKAVQTLDAEPTCPVCGTATKQVLCPQCEAQIK